MARFLTGRTIAIGVAASLGCVVAVGQVRAAGLLDLLFGGFSQPSRAPAYEGGSEPLHMTVRPRGVRVRAQRSQERRSVEAKPKLQKPIDIKAHPHWYLEDTTLRRGDIIVLKDKVLVVDDNRPKSLADFTLLKNSGRISAGERTRISQMAGLTRVHQVSAEPSVAPVVKAKTAKRARVASRAKKHRTAGGLTQEAAVVFPGF